VINKEKEKDMKDMNRITERVLLASEEGQPMSKQRSRFLSMMSVVWLIALLCGALPGAVLAGDDQDHDDATLVGTWRVTGNPGTPQEFFSLVVFNKGGTMTVTNSIPRITINSGVWKKIDGHGNFAATFEDFEDSNSDGAFDLRAPVRLTIHLLDDDSITGTGTVDVVTLDGTTQVAGPFPGIPFEGTRMQVIPE
jgi:hypothetical protein